MDDGRFLAASAAAARASGGASGAALGSRVPMMKRLLPGAVGMKCATATGADVPGVAAPG
jgi:hypothetical protein